MVVFVSGHFFHMYHDYYIGAGAIFKIPQYLYLQSWMIPVNISYGSIKHKQYNQDETKNKARQSRDNVKSLFTSAFPAAKSDQVCSGAPFTNLD